MVDPEQSTPKRQIDQAPSESASGTGDPVQQWIRATQQSPQPTAPQTGPPPPRIPPPPTPTRGDHASEPEPPRIPVKLDPKVVVTTLIAAIFGNLAFQAGAINTAAMSLFVALTSLAVFLLGNVRTKASIALLIAAVVFGGLLTLRTEPRLIVFNLLAALFLIATAATFGRGESIFHAGPVRLLNEVGDLLGSWLGLIGDTPADMTARVRVASETSEGLMSSLGRILRGAVIAVPIVIVLGMLLASADLVFASFFDFDADVLGTSILHLSLIVLAGSIVVALLRKSSRDTRVWVQEPTTTTGSPLFTIGRIEALVVLASVNLLFLLFAASQVVALSGGANAVVQDAGLTYKDYARQGFFQLLWVAGLTLVLIMAIWTMRTNRIRADGDASKQLPERVVLGVAGQAYLSGLLVFGIVAVAINRILIYIEALGLTPLRFYSSVFSLWIVVAFAIVMVRVSGYRASSDWLLPSLLLSGLLVLFGLNLANPEGIIARHNMNKQAQGFIDDTDRAVTATAVLGADMLSADGHNVLIQEIDDLPETTQDALRTVLCPRLFSPEDDRDWLAYNHAEHASQETKRAFCE